jgi:Uma2 family endonuclease
MIHPEEDKEYTVEAYFSMLKESEEKLEYHAGRVVAMAGGAPNHNEIKTATFGYLFSQLSGKCRPFDSDTAIAIPDPKRYLFPDMSFLCGEEPVYDQGGLAMLRNPALIIEVLSPGTEAYDRGDKFQYYRSLPSFREYVLIQSEKYGVEVFQREEADLWHIRSAYQRDQSVWLETLGIDLPLEKVYQWVTFSE